MSASSSSARSEVVNNAAFVFARQATAQIAEQTHTWLANDHAAHAARIWDTWENCSHEQRAGRVFELLEAANFNASAARAGAKVSATVTDAVGQSHAAADIVIAGPGVLREVQAKVYGSAPTALAALRRDEYEGMIRLVPRDQAGELDRLLAKRLEMNPDGLHVSGYEDVADQLTGELRHESISSGGVTRRELMDASESREATRSAVDRIGEELAADARQQMVATSAGVGAAVGGGIAGVLAAVRIARDEDDQRPAAQQVAEVAGIVATNGLRSGSVAGIATYLATTTADGAVGSLIRQTTAPLAIATTIVTIAEQGLALAVGEIEVTELVEHATAACVRSSAGWAYGVVGQALIPIPVVGGLVGHLVGHASAYCVMEGLKLARVLAEEADAAEEHLAWLEVQVMGSVKRLEEDRLALEVLLEAEAEQFQTTLLPLLNEFETALVAGEEQSAVASLLQLNQELGSVLGWHTRPEFDEWMADSQTVLEL